MAVPDGRKTTCSFGNSTAITTQFVVAPSGTFCGRIIESVKNKLKCNPDSNGVNGKNISSWKSDRITEEYFSMKSFNRFCCMVANNIKLNKSEKELHDRVSDEFQHFTDFKKLIKELHDYKRAKCFLTLSDYVGQVNHLFDKIRYLAYNHKLYGREDSGMVTALLDRDTSNSSQAITDPSGLGMDLDTHGIKLYVGTNNKEIDVKLSLNQLEGFQLTPLGKCYRFSNLLGGLKAVVIKMCCEFSAQEDQTGYDSMNEIKQLFDKMEVLTSGLVHSLLKDEMPYFSDKSYALVKITDDSGAILFRSEPFQPRGGWKDTQEAIDMAKVM